MLHVVKVRIYPTEEQQQFLRGQFGAVRYCYNKAVAIKKHRYKVHGENLSVIKDIKPLLTKAKKLHNHCWLKQYDSMAEQEAVRHADKAKGGRAVRLCSRRLCKSQRQLCCSR